FWSSHLALLIYWALYLSLCVYCSLLFFFFFKQKTAYEIGLGIPAEPLFRSSIFIPKLRLILILNSFLGSSDSLVFSELFHSLAPRPLAARSISDFLLTYLAT